jgi:hypothetical protein
MTPLKSAHALRREHLPPNTGHEPLPEAGATQEQRREAVRSSAPHALVVQALIAQLRAPSRPSPIATLPYEQISISAWSWSPRQRQHGPPVGHCSADSGPAHTLSRVMDGRCTAAARASVEACSLTQLSAASDIYPVDPRRRVMEHRGALGSRVALGQPFEGVVHHVIGEGHLIHREVAFEHTPIGTELLYAVC